MAATVLLGVYLGFFCLHFFVELALLLLNLRHSRACREHPPAEALALLPAPEYERALDYSRARARLAVASMSVQATLTLAFILTGALGALQGLLERLPQLASGILLVYAIALPFGIASLPFSAYSQFGIESRFGFNRMTARLFLLDLAKSLGLTLALFTPLLYLLFRLVRATPLWWLWSFALFTGVQLLLAVLYPRLIAPLFNRFTPLPAGPLRETLEELARRLGFRARGIFLMDGSRRSGHGNAYFTGLGRSKRIVLFDTLVKELTPEQTAAVLAHEIGHQKKRHVPVRLAAVGPGRPGRILAARAVAGLRSPVSGVWFHPGVGARRPGAAAVLRGTYFGPLPAGGFLDFPASGTRGRPLRLPGSGLR